MVKADADLAADRVGRTRASLVPMFVAASLLSVVVLIIVSVIAYGRVWTLHMNTTNFRLRETVHYEIPLVELRVTPDWIKDDETDLSVLLVDERFVAEGSHERWAFIHGSRTGVRGWSGEFSLLHGELYGDEARTKQLMDWSLEDRRRAEIFWRDLSVAIQSRDLDRAWMLLIEAAR